MAGDTEKLVQEYQEMNKTAFVLGYTGEVGKELVKALLGSRIFSKVVLIGRRMVTYEDELYKDVVSVRFTFGSVVIETLTFALPLHLFVCHNVFLAFAANQT